METSGQRDLPEVVADLIRQGEAWATAGELQRAATALREAWTMAEPCHPTLTDTAAWGTALVLVQLDAFQEAAVWFQRVTAPPPNAERLWPAARERLALLCAGQIGEAAQRLVAPGKAGRWMIAPDQVDRRKVVSEAGTPPLPKLAVFGLGRFRIVRDGWRLPVCPSSKAVALFRYLLTRQDRAAGRDELMDLLWAGSAPREAAHSLHVAVSALRRYLDPAGAGLVRSEGGHYLIHPDATVDDDCERFRGLSLAGDRARQAGDLPTAQEAYQEALACYGGDFDIGSHDMTWSIAERERLLARYLADLEYLGACSMRLAQFEEALGCYQQLVSRDPYREDAHANLMRCYAHLGRRGEAVRQFERCIATLRDDLGVEPLAATRDLYEAVRAGRLP